MDNRINHISKGVSEQRVQEYLRNTVEEKPLVLKTFALRVLLISVGVMLLTGFIMTKMLYGNTTQKKTDVVADDREIEKSAYDLSAKALKKNPVSDTANPAVQFEYKVQEYNKTIEGIYITKYIGTDTEVEIPNQIDGKPVFEIGDGAFKEQSYLTKVVIPEGVIKICDGAFEGCQALTEVSIPSTIIFIGNWAFNGCTSLVKAEKIEAADGYTAMGLKNIGSHIFSGCVSLESVRFGGNTFGQVQLGECAFEGCLALKELILPENIVLISKRTFYGCESLASFTIQEGITRIEEQAFAGCTSLTAVEFPGSIRYIGYETFMDCTALKNITFKEYVALTGNRISEWAEIDKNAFKNTAVETVTLPGYYSGLQENSFADCKNLKTFTWEDNNQGTATQELKGNPFSGCTSLTDVYFSECINKVNLAEPEKVTYQIHVPENSVAYKLFSEQGINVVP